MKQIIFLFFTLISFANFAQIITSSDENTENETASKEEPIKVKENKEKNIELFFGVTPAYTFRTLTTNKGIFAKPLAHREEETAVWTTGYQMGVRSKLSNHFKLEIGAGFSMNKEAFNYSEKDSVFIYTNSYRHVDIPIKIAYTYGEDISFYGALGITPKAFLSMKREETTLDLYGKEKTVISKERDHYNMFLIDATASVGVQAKLHNSYGVFAIVEGRRQLMSNYSKQSPYVRYPYALGIALGIEIYL